MRNVIRTAAVLMAMAAPLSSQAPVAPARQAVIDELVVANHILANEGVVDGYGHVSVRNPANPNCYFLASAGAPALVTRAGGSPTCWSRRRRSGGRWPRPLETNPPR